MIKEYTGRAKTKGGKPMTFKEWLDAMPRNTGRGEKLRTAPLQITLRSCDWLTLREAATYLGKTLDEIASHILSDSDELLEMSAEPAQRQRG